jgi:hypothetical protein
MKFSIEARDGYLHAVVHGRETAEHMREFLYAVHAACGQHEIPKILMSVRQSRAVFRSEDYGLDANTRGYVHELAGPSCQVALVGDTDELHQAHEYIEVLARQQGFNVRAFRDLNVGLQWLRGDGARAARRYRFARIVIAGAPESRGVFALWQDDEVVYYGRADGEGSTIRSRLLDRFQEDATQATHYSWEVCEDPAAREAELLREHQGSHGRPPRLNSDAA